MEDSDHGTAFRDVLALALLGFLCIIIIMLPHLNPPGKNSQEDITPPGNMLVEIQWEGTLDCDVDLWVQAPGDVPVGYSNKSGQIFNLLRDDLGRIADRTALNYEASYTRGLPAGEYTVNVHMYRTGNATFPVSVTTKISLKANANRRFRVILTGETSLIRLGQEITVARFSIDEDGNLVPDSVHKLFKPLRPAGSSM